MIGKNSKSLGALTGSVSVGLSYPLCESGIVVNGEGDGTSYEEWKVDVSSRSLTEYIYLTLQNCDR